MKDSSLVIAFSDGGGKAGAGFNKTATVQVRDPMPGGYLLLKQFRYTVGDKDSKAAAIAKAKAFIDRQSTSTTPPNPQPI